MRHQNRTLKLPLCSAKGKHLAGSPEFCTLEAFTRRAAELAPIDWEGECRATNTAKFNVTKTANTAVATEQMALAKVAVKEL